MTLAAYMHRLDPFAIHFTGEWGIRWYGLSYVAAFVVGYALIYLMARRRWILIDPAKVGDFVLAAAVGVVVGGRLGYAVFYQPGLLADFRGEFPFWGLLALHEGGMASHGGVIGIALACWWAARRQGIGGLHATDVVALVAPIGIFFGRFANFINAELLGRPAPDWLPWAVKYPQEIHAWRDPGHPRHELLATEQFAEVERLTRGLYNFTHDSTVALHHQMVFAARDRDLVAEALRPLLTPLHPSQLYAALLEGVAVFVILVLIWRRPRKPGVIGAWWLISYGVLRIVNEMFRMPDPHIGFQALGLTRGQWLSALMVAIGLGYLWWLSRRPVERIGGWGRAAAGANPA